MAFSTFFLAASACLLVSALFVVRRRDPELRRFAVAVTATTLVLLAGAVFRLTDPAAAATEARRLLDGVTVANLSAASVLLVVWTAGIWKASR